MMLLATPVFASSESKTELLQFGDVLYVDSVEAEKIDLQCVNIFKDNSTADNAEIITNKDCTVVAINALQADPTNKELTLSYNVDGQEIIVKIRQNYKTNLEVGQKVTAGEVIGVFDKHVRIGADLVCIGAFADGVALETSEYIKMPT